MSTVQNKFNIEELNKIDEADDLKISPFRADGITYGTPTWIWAVVVDGDLYVRAYNGQNSSWYQSAIKQKAGRIQAAGKVIKVEFEAVAGSINEQINEAYKTKYSKSPYLQHMIANRSIAATGKIIPKEF